MKNLILLSILFLFTSFSNYEGDGINGNYEKCDIKRIYTAVDLDSGTKVIDSYGNVDDADILLVPNNSLEKGRYEVSLTRKASNIYKIDRTDLYIETAYCYEYATYDDALLIIESKYGYTIGTVIFLD